MLSSSLTEAQRRRAVTVSGGLVHLNGRRGRSARAGHAIAHRIAAPKRCRGIKHLPPSKQLRVTSFERRITARNQATLVNPRFQMSYYHFGNELCVLQNQPIHWRPNDARFIKQHELGLGRARNHTQKFSQQQGTLTQRVTHFMFRVIGKHSRDSTKLG